MPVDIELTERIKPEPKTDFEFKCVEGLQLGEYEIYSEKLNNIVLEGKEILTRIGVSGFFHAGDLVVGVYTAAGDLVSAYCGVYLHSVTTQSVIKYILKYYKDDPTVGVEEGDIFYANDALYGGIHNPDQAAVMPIFYEGTLVAWAATAVHQPETGAIEPGGMPISASSRNDEGMKLPPMKIGENYQIRSDVLEMMANMISRAPRMQTVDTRARVAGCDRVRVRMQELVEQKGLETVVGAMHRMVDVSEEAAKSRVESWEDGTYRAVAFFDTIGKRSSLVRTMLTMTKKDGRLKLDFAGSSPENDGSFHAFKHMVRAHTAIYLFAVPFADLPTASGIFSPIDFEVPSGTFLNASHDASVANSPIANSGTMSVVAQAMSKLLFASGHHELATGGYGCTGSGYVAAGLNQWNVPFADMMTNPLNSEGGGARSNRDGVDSWGFPWGCWGKSPDTEDMENEQPHNLLFFKHRKNSMGGGKYRGGAGTTVAWIVHSVPFLIYQSITKNQKVPTALGLFGGYPPPVHPGIAVRGSNYFEKMANGDKDLPADAIELVTERTIQGEYAVGENIRAAAPYAADDIFVGASHGGGGYGDVLERDPEAVMEDLHKKLTTDQVASNLYKVVYDPDTLAVDLQATEQARNDEREVRKKRGKPFEEFEERWLQKRPPEEALTDYGRWPTAEMVKSIMRA